MSTEKKKYEYIWLDGYEPEPSIRSKIKVTEEEEPPQWGFDGSSTQQADGSSSDCILIPVAQYDGPLGADLVMCQVDTGEHETHPSNTRKACEGLVADDWWFGFEQEYFFTDIKGNPLGWQDGTPRPQGDYYCGVGANNVAGREISEAHLDLCLEAGLEVTGTNAKGIKAGDDLWVSRYLLHRVAEEFGVCVDLHPKPKSGDWNGSGMHTNFSNEEMRTNGSEQLMTSLCEKLGAAHEEAIKEYGSDNDKRLTGLHETQKITEFSYGISDRGASIRIPIYTIEHDWDGYLEDRRPASNADPYRIISHIVGTLS